MKTKFIVASACAIISVSTFAAAKFPSQCRVSGLRYEKDNVVLFAQHTAKPRLYVMENVSHHPIWITHQEKRDPGVSAGFASQIMPTHWSSLLMTNSNFALTCQLQEKSGKMETVPCKSVLRVCQYSQFYSKNPINGGYWVAENLPYSALEPHIRKRGFELSRSK